VWERAAVEKKCGISAQGPSAVFVVKLRYRTNKLKDLMKRQRKRVDVKLEERMTERRRR
jgi:hypothetical protein